jgi:hypothetical protein
MRANVNNPTKDKKIPNPGAFGVSAVVTAVEVGTTVSSEINVGIGVRVGVSVGGAPIAISAALALAAWSGWFSNNVP